MTAEVVPKMMDLIRIHFGEPIIIHRSHDPSASRLTSLHRSNPCIVIDFHIESVLSLYAQFIELSRFESISEIGVYPFWDNPGFHIGFENPYLKRKYWLRNKGGDYMSIDGAFII